MHWPSVWLTPSVDPCMCQQSWCEKKPTERSWRSCGAACFSFSYLNWKLTRSSVCWVRFVTRSDPFKPPWSPSVRKCTSYFVLWGAWVLSFFLWLSLGDLLFLLLIEILCANKVAGLSWSLNICRCSAKIASKGNLLTPVNKLNRKIRQ